uniref:Uncharacterized protein n=1 Tax=Rhizophora mucronata TaxID=61149 RepID=A0A2P2NU37_RHIMU
MWSYFFLMQFLVHGKVPNYKVRKKIPTSLTH